MSTSQHIPTSDCVSYQYQPLRSAQEEIRLLKLHPGRRGSSIQISLDAARFPTELPYEALSYTWGNELDKMPIYIRDGTLTWRLDVTGNCHEALHNLRLCKRVRTFWVDAICINQGDSVEKGDQVTLMAEIYRQTARVTVWLGPADLDAADAIKWFRTINRHLCLSQSTRRLVLRPGGDKKYVKRGGRVRMDHFEAVAFYNFISRPWFQRLWVWQEVRILHDRIIVKCGGHELSWRAFVVANMYLTGKSKDQPFPGCQYDLVTRLFSIQPSTTLTLLTAMRGAECQDPRDRIYVAEGISQIAWDRLKPDYTASWLEVYSMWAMKLARRGELDFLSEGGSHSTRSCLPSWIPDWTIKKRRYCATCFGFSHGGAKGFAEEVTSKHLQVMGVRIAQLCVVSGLSCVASGDAQTSIDEIREALIRDMTSVSPNGMVESHALALSCALRCNDFAERVYPRVGQHPSLKKVKRMVQRLAVETEPVSLNKASLFLYITCAAYWQGRAFFRDTQGRVGLCSAEARPGDWLVVFPGCGNPIVLRSLSHEQYEVLGGAYCNGFMEGEALLGQLPDDIEFVKYHGLDGWSPAYREKGTKKPTFEDPRLPPLPTDWKDVTDQYSPHLPQYKHAQTGELRHCFQDPRCDLPALKARGVQLQSFTLV